MKTTILRAAAAIALAAAALMAPTAANAYVDPSAIVPNPAVFPAGQSSTFTTPNSPYDGDEEVLISITGENANGATLAMVKTAVETNTSLRTRAKNGKVQVPIAFPANASGTYYLTFTGVTSGVVLKTQVTVTTPSPTPSTPPAKGGLAVTGLDGGATTGLWIVGGALVAAGGAVGVGAMVRRRRTSV